jgi:hypothetical protein
MSDERVSTDTAILDKNNKYKYNLTQVFTPPTPNE